LDKKFPVEFWMLFGSESRFGLQIRTPDPDSIHFGGGLRSVSALVLRKVIEITDFKGFVLPTDDVNLKMILTLKVTTESSPTVDR